MKKPLLLITSLLAFSFLGNAQTIVNTAPGPKHAVLEEFTGIKCVNCPAGHTEIESIVTAHPNDVHVISYGPTNSSYTNPAGTAGTDFRRVFADAFYTSAYCSPATGNRFMPSAFVNRKIASNGDILQSRSGGAWTNGTNAVLAQASPLNIGLRSIYNASAQTLTIDVEVYYTANITSSNSLYVMITEDDLTSNYQSGSSASASNPYVYQHTFRENVSVDQWGDPITGATTSGSLFTTQYVFNLNAAIDPIVIANAHVVAFVIDAGTSNKEVYTGISVNADGGQASTGTVTGINEVNDQISVSAYPNPSDGDVTINISGKKANSLQIFNILGEVVYSQKLNNTNTKAVLLSEKNLPVKGIYIIKVSGENYIKTERLVIN